MEVGLGLALINSDGTATAALAVGLLIDGLASWSLSK